MKIVNSLVSGYKKVEKNFVVSFWEENEQPAETTADEIYESENENVNNSDKADKPIT